MFDRGIIVIINLQGIGIKLAAESVLCQGEVANKSIQWAVVINGYFYSFGVLRL